MTEQEKITQQLKLEGDNLSAKLMIRIIDYIFLWVLLRGASVYFNFQIEHGMFWVFAPIIIPAIAICTIVLLSWVIPKFVQVVKNYFTRKNEAKKVIANNEEGIT